jgi:nucleotide-binding universal stress UspA family protein
MALTPSRVLIAVHGFEPGNWVADTARTVSMWSSAALRILAVPSVPKPPFTSLTPMARRAYGGARRAWREQEEARVQRVIDELKPLLPTGAEVVWVPAMHRDLVVSMAAGAGEWRADALVVGAPERTLRHWIWPGPIHQGLLRCASCPVVVIPPRTERRRASIRLASGTARRLAWLRSPQAQRGA